MPDDGDYCGHCGSDIGVQKELASLQGFPMDDLDQCQDCGKSLRHFVRHVRDSITLSDTATTGRHRASAADSIILSDAATTGHHRAPDGEL